MSEQLCQMFIRTLARFFGPNHMFCFCRKTMTPTHTMTIAFMSRPRFALVSAVLKMPDCYQRAIASGHSLATTKEAVDGETPSLIKHFASQPLVALVFSRSNAIAKPMLKTIATPIAQSVDASRLGRSCAAATAFCIAPWKKTFHFFCSIPSGSAAGRANFISAG